MNVKLLDINISKKRLPWIDYAKGIAIILVVYRHMLIGFLRSDIEVEQYLINANEIVYTFRMPLFFILSGIFIKKILIKNSIWDTIFKKFNTLLYPYLIWAFLHVTIQIILSDFTNAKRDIYDYLNILYKPRAIDHFWFLYTLFNVTIFFTIVEKLLKLKNWYHLIIGIILYSLSDFLISFSLLKDIFYYYIFFAIGNFISDYILNQNNHKFFSSKKLFLLLTIPFFLMQWYWINNPDINKYFFAFIAVFGCFYAIILSFILGESNKFKLIRYVGYHSLYIYIIHLFVTSFLRILFYNILSLNNFPVILLLVIGISLAVAIPIIFYNVTIKNGLWFLYRFKK